MAVLLSLGSVEGSFQTGVRGARSACIAAEGYRSPAEGARVSYEEEQGDKGPKAVNVTKM
jgi:cold shock CspA family protein